MGKLLVTLCGCFITLSTMEDIALLTISTLYFQFSFNFAKDMASTGDIVLIAVDSSDCSENAFHCKCDVIIKGECSVLKK